MKKHFSKISSVLVITTFLIAIFIGNASGFRLKSLTGGEKKGSVSVDTLVENQANLCKRLYAALGEINTAQMHFIKATGNKKLMEDAEENAKRLAEGNVQKDAITDVVARTNALNKEIEKSLKKAKNFDESKKRELQKGLLPYAKGTAHSVILGKEFADHLSSTKDAIKQAGITGALSVKKKLAVTLSVGPKVPKLGSNLLTTTNTAIKIAKKAKLDVSNAEGALGDLG
jgi:hypothetical protein